MSDTLPSEEEPEVDADQLASELDLGLDLSAEERAEADQMVARLRAQYGLDEETSEPEPEPVDDSELEPAAEEEPEEPPAPAPPAAPEPDPFAGIDRSEIASLIDLRNYLQSNPEKAQEVQRVLSGEPPPEPPKIPEWIDQDEPAQVAMWNHLQALEARVAQTAQAQNQIAQRQVVTKAEADRDAGITIFRNSHPKLTEDDINVIRVHAGALEIVDGLAKHMSGTDAVAKALDMAYWDHPEYRARATNTLSEAQVKKAEAAQKKQKLNALGGSSGSAQRTETKPDLSTDQKAKQAAAAWLKEQNIL